MGAKRDYIQAAGFFFAGVFFLADGFFLVASFLAPFLTFASINSSACSNVTLSGSMSLGKVALIFANFT